MDIIPQSSNFYNSAYTSAELLEMIQGEIQEIASKSTSELLSHTGVATGFAELDSLLEDGFGSGLQKGTVTLVSSRPAMGKTTFILNLIRNMCKAGIRVGLININNNSRNSMIKILSGIANINLRKALSTSAISSEEMKQLVEASEEVATFPLWIQDIPMPSPYDIRNAIIALKAQYKINILFIDGSLGPVVFPLKKKKLMRYMSGLNELSQGLNIPLVLCHTTSSMQGEREDLKPHISDVLYSESILRHVNAVILLHRDHYYNYDSDKTAEDNIEITVWSRHGQFVSTDFVQRGSTLLRFHSEYSLIESIAIISSLKNAGQTELFGEFS